MTDTERLDWLSRMLGAAVCELMFKSGLRIPAHGRLREAIDTAMEDAAQFDKPSPPYPFCEHPEKCIAARGCERTVKGEPWSCAD